MYIYLYHYNPYGYTISEPVLCVILDIDLGKPKKKQQKSRTLGYLSKVNIHRFCIVIKDTSSK